MQRADELDIPVTVSVPAPPGLADDFFLRSPKIIPVFVVQISIVFVPPMFAFRVAAQNQSGEAGILSERKIGRTCNYRVDAPVGQRQSESAPVNYHLS